MKTNQSVFWGKNRSNSFKFWGFLVLVSYIQKYIHYFFCETILVCELMLWPVALWVFALICFSDSLSSPQHHQTPPNTTNYCHCHCHITNTTRLKNIQTPFVCTLRVWFGLVWFWLLVWSGLVWSHLVLVWFFNGSRSCARRASYSCVETAAPRASGYGSISSSSFSSLSLFSLTFSSLLYYSLVSI